MRKIVPSKKTLNTYDAMSSRNETSVTAWLIRDIFIFEINSSINPQDLEILSTFKFLDDIPQETGPETSCISNKDCWCREFTGAEFIPGHKVEGFCDITKNRCQQCLYY